MMAVGRWLLLLTEILGITIWFSFLLGFSYEARVLLTGYDIDLRVGAG